MSNIIIPQQHQSVNFNDISKKQLARLVNDQSEVIRRESEQRAKMASLIIGLVKNHEDFRVDAEGVASIGLAAIQSVQDGIELEVKTIGDRVYVRCVDPKDRPKVEAPPQLVMPTNGFGGKQ